MVSEYMAFDDLLSFVVDNRGRTCPTDSQGLPLIATNCISNKRLYPTKENVRYVNNETYLNWFRAHPQPGDIIFVLKGAPGRCCLVPDPVDFCIAQDMVAVRADSTKIYPWYLFAVLRSPLIQEYIDRLHVGTMIPHFKKGDFNKLLIPIPDRSTQEFIGDAYMALVEKIELNQRMNDTLEEMARAIFKDWFVDFGPTRTKAEGRDPYLAPDLWSVFPARLDEDKPAGWIWQNLAQATESIQRGLSPSYVEDGGVLVLNQKCIRDRRLDTAKGRRHDSSIKPINGRALANGDILVNSTGVGTLGRVAQVWHLPEAKTIVDSHVTVVRPDNAVASPLYLGFNLTGRETEIEALGEGSTGQTELARARLGDLPILVPSQPAQRALEQLIRPMVERMVLNDAESRTLAQTRDLLLPKLMSGEISVRDAKVQIRGAL